MGLEPLNQKKHKQHYGSTPGKISALLPPLGTEGTAHILDLGRHQSQHHLYWSPAKARSSTASQSQKMDFPRHLHPHILLFQIIHWSGYDWQHPGHRTYSTHKERKMPQTPETCLKILQYSDITFVAGEIFIYICCFNLYDIIILIISLLRLTHRPFYINHLAESN